ncbi:MAG: ABC transporter ATP-binding protein [bacterium]
MSLIEAKSISRWYEVSGKKLYANKDISFAIEEKEVVVILGKSGAGKTTLLNSLGAMDSINEGELIVNGQDIAKFNNKQLGNYRRNDIGFVFQFYNLMPNLTVLENVELAASTVKEPLDCKEILEGVGLGHRLDNFPNQLSGGEQQRVAIARAIVKNPLLLLCDEPTGALDTNTGKKIIELLLEVNQKYNKTIIIVTHNSELVKIANRLIRVSDGTIVENIELTPQKVDDIKW